MPLFRRSQSQETVDVRYTLLDKADAIDFLRTRGIATVAFTLRNRATAEPAYYALDPDFPEWLYLRPMPGSVIGKAMSNPWVAITVREEQSATQWENVVVYGRLYALTSHGTDASPKPHARGVDLLRAVAPDLPTGAAAMHEVLFRMSVDNVTGRACTAVRRRTTPPPSGAE